MTRSKKSADMQGESSDKEDEEMSSQDDDQVDAQETMEDVKSMRMMKAAKQHREQSINASYLNVVKEMNALNKDASQLTLKEVPVTVLAEVRHCVQLLGHINEVYRAAAFPLLQAYMMRYPVLLPCAVNNIFFIYANAKNKFQKQAKLMGVGAVLRCDAAVHDKSLLRKLVSEIITLRNPSDRDDAEIFFLVSALQADAAVQTVSEIILEGMGDELQHSIKELKPSLLWLRVVLAQRMLATGLKLPVWLKDTFLPDRVVQFGLIIMPKSQKVEPQHPMFESFISTLAAFDHTLKKMRKKKPSLDGRLPKPSAVAILFREEISPAIEKCFGEKKKKPTLEIAYKLLQSVLTCDQVEVSVLEGVVQWLGGGGLRCLTPDMRSLVVQGLLARLSSLACLETDEERSTLAVCVLQGAVVFPEMLQHAKEHLHHLTASAAQACVDDLLRAFWRKLSEVEASVLLRLVALRQCSGKDHLEWRLKVTQSMTRKALQASSDEDIEKKEEEERVPLDQDSKCILGEHINNRDLFFRFLNHCSHDKSTVCDVLIEAHRVAVKEVRDNPEVLPAEVRELWQRLTEKIEFLQSPQSKEFAFNKLFQVLFSQFALELLKKSLSESEDLLSDLETCLEKALAEEQPQGVASLEVSSKKQKEREEEVDWVLVLVDVLLALGAREDSWWRAILQPAARQLSRRMTAECAASITEVLLRDDVLQPDDDDDDEMEHDREQGERDDWEDVDEEEAEGESEEEAMEEESEKEENSDDMNTEDEDSGGDDCDSDGGEESDEGDDEDMTRLDVIKTALRGAMMPIPNTSFVSDDLLEDMDAVPIEELRLMDKRMAKVLGEHIKKRPKSGKKKFSLKGESAQRLQYRNRALDLVEGLVQGSPLPSVLLGSVLLPLLRALELHHSKLMRPLVNRIREVLKEVRNVKKFNAQSEPLEDVALVDFLDEVFSLADKVPECSLGVVTLLRYSNLRQRDQDTASNPVMDVYVRHIKDMLQSRKINKSVIVEPLNLDMPTLRIQIIETIIAKAFSTTPTTCLSSAASLSNTTQNSSDRSSNDTDASPHTTYTADAASITTDTASRAADAARSGAISKSRQHAAWDLLKDVFAKTLTSACTELSKRESAALTSLGLYIEQYFTACQDLVKKELEPISMILKLIRKHPASTGCVNWLNLGSSLRAFRSRMSPKLVGKKKLKKDVDRLATIVLQPVDGHCSVIDEEKLCLKRKRKELKREKKQSKKTKIYLNDQQNQSISKTMSIDSKKKDLKQKNTKTKSVDDLFEAEDAFLDANDSDSDKEDSDDGDAAGDKMIKTKLALAKSNKEKKAAKTRARKMRYKANQKLKKEVAREMKQRMWTENRQLAGEQEETDGGKENTGPEAGDDRAKKDSKQMHKKKSPQERRPKEQPKTGKWKAAEALDVDLQAGIFSQGSLVE